MKKQGKSHIPLEHVDPNLQMFYCLQINMHVLLITWGLGITYLLACAMFT
ncbi:hypothetical protein GCM10007857_91090 [Bradyrhizobium iriomotense]|uniref:Uncharacterized protein n=1 Tax=Bradyrhizobium iriomotense TaxID=441950 RepID=A0ABQ6BDC2_9BRAD|nr:hypothetical protein GCM10007857_91090 [Bradyrhizobium iriomotense]